MLRYDVIIKRSLWVESYKYDERVDLMYLESVT